MMEMLPASCAANCVSALANRLESGVDLTDPMIAPAPSLAQKSGRDCIASELMG